MAYSMFLFAGLFFTWQVTLLGLTYLSGEWKREMPPAEAGGHRRGTQSVWFSFTPSAQGTELKGSKSFGKNKKQLLIPEGMNSMTLHQPLHCSFLHSYRGLSENARVPPSQSAGRTHYRPQITRLASTLNSNKLGFRSLFRDLKVQHPHLWDDAGQSIISSTESCTAELPTVTRPSALGAVMPGTFWAGGSPGEGQGPELNQWEGNGDGTQGGRGHDLKGRTPQSGARSASVRLLVALVRIHQGRSTSIGQQHG